MAADGLRRVLQRSLPVLLVILMALVASPQRPAPSHGPAAPHTAASPASAEQQPETAAPCGIPPAAAVADRTATLSTQFTAGVRGSRAPPPRSA